MMSECPGDVIQVWSCRRGREHNGLREARPQGQYHLSGIQPWASLAKMPHCKSCGYGAMKTALRVFVLFGMLCSAPTLFAEAAEAPSSNSWLGSMFGLPSQTKLSVSDAELQSLGCMAGGASVTVAGILFGGAAIVATGGRNAGAAGKVAVPVIAAATMAGCLVGNSSALGIAWLMRNWDTLAGKVVNALPEVPDITILPKKP